MKKLISLALILATVCWVKDDAPALPSAAKPKGVLVDRAAVALFDRSSKFYGECKTIRLRWTTRDESPSPDNAQKPTVTTIVFVRPSLSKVEIKNGLVPRAVSLVDGKFFWALANVSSALTTYSKEHLNKDETPLENSLLNLVFGTNNPGMIFYNWLGGKHELQSEQIKLMQEPHFNMMYFVATKLAPSNWKGRSWERVQIRERLCPQEDAEIADYDVNEDAVFNRIYWLAPDNARLVKMEELDAQGKVVFIHEIVEQTFNIAIPASIFVFKIPKGARKE